MNSAIRSSWAGKKRAGSGSGPLLRGQRIFITCFLQSRKNSSQHLLRAEFLTETKLLSFMGRICPWKRNEDGKGDPPKSRMNMKNQISRESGCKDLAVLLCYICCSCPRLEFQANVPKNPSVHYMPAISLPQLSFPPHLDCQFSREQLQGTVGQSAENSFLSTCFMLCESSWREGINYYKLPVYAKRCLHKLLESPLELVEQCSPTSIKRSLNPLCGPAAEPSHALQNSMSSTIFLLSIAQNWCKVTSDSTGKAVTMLWDTNNSCRATAVSLYPYFLLDSPPTLVRKCCHPWHSLSLETTFAEPFNHKAGCTMESMC